MLSLANFRRTHAHVQELRSGIKQLPGANGLHLTRDEFDQMTEHGKYVDERGAMSRHMFRIVIMKELGKLAGRGIQNMLAISDNEEFRSTVLQQKLMECRMIDNFNSVSSQLSAISDTLKRLSPDAIVGLHPISCTTAPLAHNQKEGSTAVKSHATAQIPPNSHDVSYLSKRGDESNDFTERASKPFVTENPAIESAEIQVLHTTDVEVQTGYSMLYDAPPEQEMGYPAGKSWEGTGRKDIQNVLDRTFTSLELVKPAAALPSAMELKARLQLGKHLFGDSANSNASVTGRSVGSKARDTDRRRRSPSPLVRAASG